MDETKRKWKRRYSNGRRAKRELIGFVILFMLLFWLNFPILILVLS